MTKLNPISKILNWIKDNLGPDEAEKLAANLETEDKAAKEMLNWAKVMAELQEKGHYQDPPKFLRENLRKRFSEYSEKETIPKKSPNKKERARD